MDRGILPQKGVSVVLCGHNSAWILPRTLASLAAQIPVKDLPWEICIIDNNSDDETVECAQQFARAHAHLDISILTEPRQGQSYARIRGFHAAKYPILVLCDDDTLLCADYVKSAFEFMQSHPGVGLCGGLGVPLFESEPDSRILPYLDLYATGPQGPQSNCDITECGFVHGAGAVVRKSALDAILFCGFEFFSLGRKGKLLTGGEDVELGRAIKAAGYRIYYNADLKYEHVLPSRRLTWDYLNRLAFWGGYSSVVMPWPKTLFTHKSHPFYVVCWTLVQFFTRGIVVWLGRPRPNQIMAYSTIQGVMQGLLNEFSGLFERRRKARVLYRKLRDFARTNMGDSAPV